MVLVKRTYNLPADRLAEFEERVPTGRRSALVGQLIESWLEEQRIAKLRAEIIEGLEANREFDEQIEREWSHLSDEVWAQLPDEEWPEPKEVW